MLEGYGDLYDNFLRLLLALVLGSLLGAEREYKSRNVGFRTTITITLGAALFTILSIQLEGVNQHYRLFSNIVTGVGFLGAGAILRDGLAITGATTASVIWVSAAIGMACGTGQFEIAMIVTGMVLIVLIGLSGIQKFLDRRNREILYSITIPVNLEMRDQVEKLFGNCNLRYAHASHKKRDNELVIEYRIRGKARDHNRLVETLALDEGVKGFFMQAG